MRRFAAPLVLAAALWAQNPEFDFYPEFRRDWGPARIDAYAAELRARGIDETEIARRRRLVETARPALDADYWDRFSADPNSAYNRRPNAFLMDFVKGRKPGAALDYAMGDGRNALYLARLGWTVAGFDPAAAAVAAAHKRARAEGLNLETAAVRDDQYDFGTARFDLIVFSWSMPLVPTERVIAALKPGGYVVMECGADFVGRNEMLKKSDALRIVRYEIVRAVSDFYDRRETEVLRLVAVKP